jgi:hypothetical protein
VQDQAVGMGVDQAAGSLWREVLKQGLGSGRVRVEGAGAAAGPPVAQGEALPTRTACIGGCCGTRIASSQRRSSLCEHRRARGQAGICRRDARGSGTAAYGDPLGDSGSRVWGTGWKSEL